MCSSCTSGDRVGAGCQGIYRKSLEDSLIPLTVALSDASLLLDSLGLRFWPLSGPLGTLSVTPARAVGRALSRRPQATGACVQLRLARAFAALCSSLLPPRTMRSTGRQGSATCWLPRSLALAFSRVLRALALPSNRSRSSAPKPAVGAAPATRRSLVGLARSRACSPRTSFPDGVEAWRCCAVRTPALWDRPGRSVLECAGRERQSVRQSTNYRRQRRPDNKSPASAAGDRCGIH